MFTHRPLVLALSTCLLQACVSPPTKQAIATEFAIQPVLRVRHSADQNAATYYQLAKYHLEQGNLDFARSAYEASILLDGKQLEARNGLAALHATQGRLEEAKNLFLQIVADFPQASHPYNNIGYIYYLQNNYDAAVLNLQRALALDSGNDRARHNLDAVHIALAKNGGQSTVEMAMAPPSTSPNLPTPHNPAVPVTIPTLPSLSTPATTHSSPSTLSTQTTSIQQTEPVSTLAAADARTQGLAIISPPLQPQSRMEVVQILPNVYELKLRSATEIVLTEMKVEKSPVTLAQSLAAPARAMVNALEKAITKASPITTVKLINVKTSRIEVANGNGVNGMAKRVSKVLGQQGIAVSLLTNEQPYKQQATKIQYRLGYVQTAMRLKNAMQGHAVLDSSPNLSGNSDVRLVLGKDVLNQMALIEELANVSTVASN